jgi:hypothetical protein
MSSENTPNWPPLLGHIVIGEVALKVPGRFSDLKYLPNPKVNYYCPSYFYDGKDPYPKSFMHGAGYFLPWCQCYKTFLAHKLQILVIS